MNKIQICYKKLPDTVLEEDSEFTYHLDTGDNVFKIYKNIRESRKTVKVYNIPFDSVFYITTDYDD